MGHTPELTPHTPTELTDMPDTHTLLDTTDTLLVLLTLLARDLLTLMLKLNHGWLMLTTDMLDIHTLMPELTVTHMALTVSDTTDMLLEELTSSARDPLMLKLSQKLGMVPMVMDILDTHTATDTPDTHMVMPDTHTLTDTEIRLVKY